jgi:2-polyprenyl-3-methyl-5-hydroxy-6-metoxy-1,4-benzoquinol methylase
MRRCPTDFNYNSIPAGYYDAVFHGRRGAQSKWHHLKFDRVRREIVPNKRHLDIACGSGTFIGTLDNSIQSTGVDLAAPQIAYANEHYAAPHKKFATMLPGRLPLADEDMDVITMIELIEHLTIAETQELLRECSRVLKPRGKIIITTPNYASFWPVLEWGLNHVSKISYEDQHITKYTGKRLARLLTDTSFTIKKIHSILFLSPFVATLSWRLSGMVARLEDPLLQCGGGHLLLGVAEKS